MRMARVYELGVHELLGRAGFRQLCDMEPEEAELLSAFRRMDAPTRQALLAHVRGSGCGRGDLKKRMLALPCA